jgi:rhamnosyltransferase
LDKVELMLERNSTAIVIPTLNAASKWPKFASGLLTCLNPWQVLVIDSSSTDGTAELARSAGFRVYSRSRSAFKHGETRQIALELVPDADRFVYLTQDAILADAADALLDAFESPEAGVAYERQLPRHGAEPLQSDSRLFNYPAQSVVCNFASRKQFGLKTIFISDSFAAYRRSALEAIGGFAGDVIFGEDTIAAAMLLMAGCKLAYVAEARVYHSHSYTPRQEFKRYFDIGVLHARQADLLAHFGRAGGEGFRFVRSELGYFWPRQWFLWPSALLGTALKLISGALLCRQGER